jgi:23S rRNA (cytidine2498-2'-O)-methyltransferase
MSQFFFALTNIEAEPLLKFEVKDRYEGVRLSYSRPGFLTFKADRTGDFDPYMARLSGVCLGKVNRSDLKFTKAWVWKIDSQLVIPPELEQLSQKSLFRVGEKVTLIMMVAEDEFWVGEYVLKKHHFQTPGEITSIAERSDVPSRAYYKIAEVQEAFDLDLDHQTVLELGSAPGGASVFLLEQDMKVLGVDPADMDEKVLKNNRFKHLRRSFETLVAHDFKEPIDWIVSDINLPPSVIMKEVLRLLTFLEPHGLILTLKLNKESYLFNIRPFKEALVKRGFEVQVKYLPSHRQEIALIAQRT